jgi:hypothetical protein
MPVMKQLCSLLKQNTTLERLTAEHCDIDFGQIQCLALALPEMKGLRHLSLDGNDFTWNPLRNGYSYGASMLAASLEDNRVLLSVEMGETGQISFPGGICCTPPTYVEHLSVAIQAKSRIVFERNKLVYRVYKRTKLQHAVIRTVTLLLNKMEEPDEKKETRLNI